MNIENLPEVFLSDSATSYKVSRLVRQKKVRNIVGKLYTSNMTDDLDRIIHRRIWEIVALLFPGAIVADRTAFDLKPNDHGEIFIISRKTRPISVGSYTIYPRKGSVALNSDTPFISNLYCPSAARKFLENMRTARRGKSWESRYLSQKEIERRIDAYIRINGESAVNTLRDEMRILAPVLHLEKEFQKIDKIIGAMLRTHSTKLESAEGIARASGDEFDPNRVLLFTLLYEELANMAPIIRKSVSNNYPVLCFYEAYFSNYIEGTKFPVHEAFDIVFENKIPEDRPKDAHDIYGTYNVLSNMQEMRKAPRTLDDLIYLLRSRHRKIMAVHSAKHPGEFKKRTNVAGSTVFVEPNLIVGTLKQGFELYKKLDNAFARATYMAFLISEIHPFDDGNGRLSRIMMNAELVAANEQRIVIPTVYCENYLQALKGLSHNKITDAFVKAIDFAQKYTHSIDWTDPENARDMLNNTNAFTENSEDETAILRLPKHF